MWFQWGCLAGLSHQQAKTRLGLTNICVNPKNSRPQVAKTLRVSLKYLHVTKISVTKHLVEEYGRVEVVVRPGGLTVGVLPRRMGTSMCNGTSGLRQRCCAAGCNLLGAKGQQRGCCVVTLGRSGTCSVLQNLAPCPQHVSQGCAVWMPTNLESLSSLLHS